MKKMQFADKALLVPPKPPEDVIPGEGNLVTHIHYPDDIVGVVQEVKKQIVSAFVVWPKGSSLRSDWYAFRVLKKVLPQGEKATT